MKHGLSKYYVMQKTVCLQPMFLKWKIKKFEVKFLKCIMYEDNIQAVAMYYLFAFQKVLRDQPELLQQFKSPDRITDVLSALSDIIGKAKENGE